MAPTRLSRGLSSLGPETGLTVSSAVLPGGGLRPAQQPGGGPAAVGGREAQDASTPGQAAEADGGRLPVAEAGGESPGEEKAQQGEGEDMPRHHCWTPSFLNNFTYFFYFWLCWVFVSAHRPFSSCGKLLYICDAQSFHGSGFSCCRAQAFGSLGFSSCGSQALEHNLSSCGAWA